MQNLFQDLKHLLTQDERLTTQDGKLLKNLVIELGLKLDADLLRLLLSHDRIRQHFFAQVDGILVFDKDKFHQFVSNKQFLPDSYTAFKNKIGLSDDGGQSYISRRREVALVWPYKDCVLEGGQTKEDAKRNEVFWNTTLAPDDVNRLLDPKVLTNFRRVDAAGERPAAEIADSDNLIIKGNNLLALHSLTRRFGGQVKLIYIDPPYNTEEDSFSYNDTFDQSTWLTFLKNRLEIARMLLVASGSIWINIDDNGAHYLKVLCDEIFGRENFIASVVWQKRISPESRLPLGAAHDYILVYAKDITKTKNSLNRLPLSANRVKEYRNPDGDSRGVWASRDITGQIGHATESQFYKIISPTGEKILPPEGRCWAISESTFKELLKDNRIWFGIDGTARPRMKIFLSETEGTTVWTWWPNSEVGHNQEAKKESIALFGVSHPFSTPKPERLLQRIIHIGSDEGDLVVDFFAGSGTTGAVALKMGRRFALVEQMDYLETTTIPRLQKVIAGEQGGISEDVDWQGGGDFVACELMQWNERYVQRIQAAASAKELRALWQEMQAEAFLSYKVDVASVNEHAEAFADLALEEQKRFLLEILNHNALYVNFSEIDDADYEVSEEDKHLNAQFYGQEV